jgi:zinc-finger of acetyl-transferase ESCO
VSTTCDTCGLTYMSESPEDRAQHRKHHAETMCALQPRPRARFVKLLKNATEPVLVTASSPRWLQDEGSSARAYVRDRVSFLVKWHVSHQPR